MFFRKSLPQADDLIEEAKEIYCAMGGLWQEQKKQFTMPGGGRVRFRALETNQDAEKYQGQNLSDCAVEEAGNYADPSPIWKLFGALRSKGGVKTQLILTANPGGVGHHWLKKMFINPAPLGLKILQFKLPTGRIVPYIYIPSRVSDNKILLANDPDYVDNLHLVGSPELVRAWLEGDWEIHEGSYFPEFSSRHIVRPFTIPKHWERLCGFDWGYKSPFAAIWGAISSGKDDAGNEIYTPCGKHIPKGAIVLYREWSDSEMDNDAIAKGMLERSRDEQITTWVADPSIFNHQGGPSIYEQFRKAGINFKPGDNERISGWNEYRRRLKPDTPMFYTFETNKGFNEALASLPMCPRNAEDADTKANDHYPDAGRYLLKLRTIASQYTEVPKKSKMGNIYVEELLNEAKRDRNRPRV